MRRALGGNSIGPAGHFGLGMLRERAGAIGAALTITSAPGAGTILAVSWHTEGNADG